ncbi:MAG: hypothetical protein GXC72_10105 [Chitinophagaceae bacterium]|nr:hypothetical protein [Chitinophagaceae bacterium]
MKKCFVACLLLLSVSLVKAQTATDSIKAVINQMFAGMKNADSAMVVGSFTENGILQTIARDKEGQTIVRTEQLAEFGHSMARLAKGAADERIVFEAIHVDGALASVWTPYKFYFNGNFSHCGVNSFQLVRGKEGWKIQYIIDTRRKQPCE